jgi:L-serine dehydratase
MKNIPSIFNDIIGPVMRGPSSSHCAGALRIGRMARDLMGGSIFQVEIEYDTMGSLATTHISQGSDMGLFCGLLGYDVTDELLLNYKEEIINHNISIDIKYKKLNDAHPNTYNLLLKNGQDNHKIKAISTGGGMVEVIEIDGVAVNINGGYFETVLFVDELITNWIEIISGKINAEEISLKAGDKFFVNIKTTFKIDDDVILEIKKICNAVEVKTIFPVLPVLSKKEIIIPFTTADEMIEYNMNKRLQLWELALEYESKRGDVPKEEVMRMMDEITKVIINCVETGLNGTEFNDRILPAQSLNFNKLNDENKLLGSGLQNLMILYISAIMEVKSSMGVIVAAPTAGSCGACPGAIYAAVKYLQKDSCEMSKALLIAGLIGVFIAYKSTFAAEEAGCQAETGAGAGMAAAALVYLNGGSVEQSLGAASMAIQNSLGLICDPIANRVEAPCIGRNVMAAVNALACANMALANYLHLIQFDEVIDVYDEVGRKISREYRCTGLGGLSATNSARTLEAKLNLK